MDNTKLNQIRSVNKVFVHVLSKEYANGHTRMPVDHILMSRPEEPEDLLYYCLKGLEDDGFIRLHHLEIDIMDDKGTAGLSCDTITPMVSVTEKGISWIHDLIACRD